MTPDAKVIRAPGTGWLGTGSRQYAGQGLTTATASSSRSVAGVGGSAEGRFHVQKRCGAHLDRGKSIQCAS